MRRVWLYTAEQRAECAQAFVLRQSAGGEEIPWGCLYILTV